jgi:hypothetical protein
MEETLYSIEIHKDKDIYLGKIHSNVGDIAEFKNHRIESLLRDLLNDMQLTFDSFSNSSKVFVENKGEKQLYSQKQG